MANTVLKYTNGGKNEGREGTSQSRKLLWVGGGAGIGNLVLSSRQPKEEDLQVSSSSGS